MNVKKNKSTQINFLKIFVILISLYIVFAIAFYFLVGYQLHYRQSKGNIDMLNDEAVVTELYSGVVVEQKFNSKIQRLKSISVQWGTYYRENVGTVTMELYDSRNGELLMSSDTNASDISEGGVITLSSDEMIEGVFDAPLILRIFSDSVLGSAVAPLMSNMTNNDECLLLINGEPVQGTLCFSANGEDYIWTGLHYWKFVFLFGAAIALYLGFEYKRWKQGKSSMLVNGIFAIHKYKFLIKKLVDRDFKAKYKRSVLGVFWSFLNPLLTMVVQYIVFSNLFRFDVPNYQVYLLSGIIIFNYFSESCGMALTSIVGNASLITKVYVPKYIYPLTRILSSLVNLAISIIPLLMVSFVSGILPTKAYLLIPFMLVCLATFCLGLGMFLAAAMVFFRDIQFLWGVLTMIWMYLTPIFYPESILPEQVAWVLKFNPLYYFITFLRTCIMQGISPEPVMYFQCAMMAIISFTVGAFVFKKSQDNFVLYL